MKISSPLAVWNDIKVVLGQTMSKHPSPSKLVLASCLRRSVLRGVWIPRYIARFLIVRAFCHFQDQFILMNYGNCGRSRSRSTGACHISANPVDHRVGMQTYSGQSISWVFLALRGRCPEFARQGLRSFFLHPAGVESIAAASLFDNPVCSRGGTRPQTSRGRQRSSLHAHVDDPFSSNIGTPPARK